MKKTIVIYILTLLCVSIHAQTQQLTRINSLINNEKIDFKYNYKNQLISFIEIGTISLREYNLKYDKEGRLSETTMNRDKGDLIIQSKYKYNHAISATSPDNNYISEETTTSGKSLQKRTDINKIFIDANERLTNTFSEDGTPWEDFEYDNSNNLIKYTLHLDAGKESKVNNYAYDNEKSIFSNIGLPLWFWPYHINNLKWCSEFTGKNSAIKRSENTKYEPINITITYEYDNNGYPSKQFYDGKLVREFIYRKIK